MARDLKAGDEVRTLGSTARIEAVSEDQIQPVFNLDIAATHSFYAGPCAAMVHDNSVPGTREASFDVRPLLTAAP